VPFNAPLADPYVMGWRGVFHAFNLGLCRQKTERRKQKAESRKRKAESRKRKAEGRTQKARFICSRSYSVGLPYAFDWDSIAQPAFTVLSQKSPGAQAVSFFSRCEDFLSCR